ncbi:MAG: hypothetical protein KDE53_15100, partial [Caldilineaceae bacterium]|nr:hypothetical protein [Caldilineaceae bacterium]
MTDIILTGGGYSYDPAEPFKSTFANATDLRFPFTGTLVLPRPRDPLYNPAMEEAQVAALNDHDWLFYSYLYPRRPEDGSAEMLFPTLRTPANQPFKVSGDIIIWIAQDDAPFAERAEAQLFSTLGGLYDARYPENIAICAKPRYLLLKLHDLPMTGLPTDAPPFNAYREYTLRGQGPLATVNLPSSLSGEIYAFDLAGHQIEGYAALVALGVDKAIANAPAAHEFLVQFVDLHGSPLAKTALPVKALTVNTPLLGDAVGEPEHHLYTLTFPNGSQERSLSLSTTAAPGDATDYHYQSTHVAYWPGAGFGLAEVISGTPKTLYLKKDFAGSRVPRFLRLCVFHPGDEFQSTVGGALNADGVFAENKFKLFTKENEVAIYNTGDLFFADLHKELTKPQPGEQIKEIYLANWRSSAHLFLEGNFPAYGLTASNADRGQIADDLITILGDHVVVPLDGYASPDRSANRFLLLGRTPNSGQAIGHTFQVRVEAVTETIPIVEPKETHKGFVRAGSLFAWQLWGQGGALFDQHRIRASWKTSVGDVPTVDATLDQPAAPLAIVCSLPTDLVELAIDDSDPPNATLVRTLAYDGLLSALAAQYQALEPPQNSPYQVDAQLALLFLHLTSGRHELIPLNPNDTTRGDNNLLLHTFDSDDDRIFATEPMAVAIVDQQVLDAGGSFHAALVTRFREITYAVSAFQSGALPLSEYEWGGILRKLVAKGVTVKALYWDHIQANLAPGLSLDRGLSNSASLSAVLNRVVASKRGHAI